MIATIDFETRPITAREPWPEPVGCAVKVDGRKPEYLAWGHDGGGNNTSRSSARDKLYQLVRDADRVLMFNAPFDRGVAARHLGLTIPWSKVEDAQILAFLAEPYAQRLDLKSVSHRMLGDPPDEMDALNRWIKANVVAAKGKRKLGVYISWAPAPLVATYAKSDVDRTWGLWRYWQTLSKTRAYKREVELLAVLDDMTSDGIPLDHEGLEVNLPVWRATLKRVESYLRRMLGGDVDLGSHDEIADALEKRDLVKEWIETATGKRSLAYDALSVLVAEGNFDARFAEAWGYRSVLAHSLVTFAEPWLEAGEVLHPQWNGTRQERGGARTGRLSSTPNVQNIVKNPPRFRVPRSWPALPRMRYFVRAPHGACFGGADISQQELRILADRVGSPLVEWYREDPRLDLHEKVSELIYKLTGIKLDRGIVKQINFAKIYGSGVARTAKQVGCSEADARMFRNAHSQALPGIRVWERKLAAQARFATAGGREYCHDPERPYKSGNTDIQGSAADQSKEIMLAVQPELKRLGGGLRLMAHDEFVALVPKKRARDTERVLLEAIESTGHEGSRQMFRVPMRGDSYVRTRWQEAA